MKKVLGIVIIIIIFTLINGCIEEDQKEDIPNLMPVLDLSETPSTGYSDATINFTSICYDPDGIIILYEWDFDGDGIFDWNSTISGNISYSYHEDGPHNAICRITDDGFHVVEKAIQIEILIRPIPGPILLSPTIKYDQNWNGRTVSNVIYLNGSTFTSNENETMNQVIILIEDQNFDCYYYDVNCTNGQGYGWSYKLDTKQFFSEQIEITVIADYSKWGDVSNSTFVKISNYRNLTLYVSNQDTRIDPIRISVRLGGLLIIQDDFYLTDENGRESHNWIEYIVNISCGPNNIEGYVNANNASFNDTFVIIGNSFAIIDYYGATEYLPPLDFRYAGTHNPLYIS